MRLALLTTTLLFAAPMSAQTRLDQAPGLTDAMGGGATVLVMFVVLLLVVLLVLWILFPFAVFGTKPLLQRLIDQQQRSLDTQFHQRVALEECLKELRQANQLQTHNAKALRLLASEVTRETGELSTNKPLHEQS